MFYLTDCPVINESNSESDFNFCTISTQVRKTRMMKIGYAKFYTSVFININIRHLV